MLLQRKYSTAFLFFVQTMWWRDEEIPLWVQTAIHFNTGSWHYSWSSNFYSCLSKLLKLFRYCKLSALRSLKNSKLQWLHLFAYTHYNHWDKDHWSISEAELCAALDWCGDGFILRTAWRSFHSRLGTLSSDLQ